MNVAGSGVMSMGTTRWGSSSGWRAWRSQRGDWVRRSGGSSGHGTISGRSARRSMA
jgi:hypothetical protein